MALIDDLREECDELYAFVRHIPEEEWREPTAFWRWTTFDQILHLVQVDRFALTSVNDPDEFSRTRAAIREAAAAGVELSDQARSAFGHLSKGEVLDLWRQQYLELCTRLSARGAKDRLAWFGPDMSVSSMIAARQMEVWAHGQDIYDLFYTQRAPTSRLWNICDLGVKTYGWTFDNRGLARPGPAPAVVLAAPGGDEWRWNEGALECVAGPAADFALVVTRRRAAQDTALVCNGAAATSWMSMAQCFAGPPADGPSPGERASTLAHRSKA